MPDSKLSVKHTAFSDNMSEKYAIISDMETQTSLVQRVRSRIEQRGRGAVFGPTDFIDLGSRAAVDQALSRLARDGAIRRIRRGIYDFPRVNARLGITLSPAPDAVAQTLARARHADIQVSGAQAANLLGLTDQVPARVVYLTEAASASVQVGEQTIQLRHASPRHLKTAGRISGVVFQALRHLGKAHVTDEVLERLRRALSPQDREVIRQDILLAPGWMQFALRGLVGERDGLEREAERRRGESHG